MPDPTWMNRYPDYDSSWITKHPSKYTYEDIYSRDVWMFNDKNIGSDPGTSYDNWYQQQLDYGNIDPMGPFGGAGRTGGTDQSPPGGINPPGGANASPYPQNPGPGTNYPGIPGPGGGGMSPQGPDMSGLGGGIRIGGIEIPWEVIMKGADMAGINLGQDAGGGSGGGGGGGIPWEYLGIGGLGVLAILGLIESDKYNSKAIEAIEKQSGAADDLFRMGITEYEKGIPLADAARSGYMARMGLGPRIPGIAPVNTLNPFTKNFPALQGAQYANGPGPTPWQPSQGPTTAPPTQGTDWGPMGPAAADWPGNTLPSGPGMDRPADTGLREWGPAQTQMNTPQIHPVQPQQQVEPWMLQLLMQSQGGF
jgi:hypothetical protein